MAVQLVRCLAVSIAITGMLVLPAAAAGPSSPASDEAPALLSRAASCALVAGTRRSPTGTGIIRPKVAQAADGTIIAVGDAEIIARDSACNLIDGPMKLADLFSDTGVGANEVFGFWDVIFNPVEQRFILFAVSLDTVTNDKILYVAASETFSAAQTGGERGVRPLKRKFRKRVRTLFVRAPQELAICQDRMGDVDLADLTVGEALGRLFLGFNLFNSSTGLNNGFILDIELKDIIELRQLKLRCLRGRPFMVAPRSVQAAAAGPRAASRTVYFVSVPLLGNTLARYALDVGPTLQDDQFSVLPDATMPDFRPATYAVQPNGIKLYHFLGAVREGGVQIGKSVWLTHAIDDESNPPFAGHSRVQIIKVDAGSNAATTLNLSTLEDGHDDTFSPSLDISGGEAFLTFMRTISDRSRTGKVTRMLARGPTSLGAGWSFSVLEQSPGQFTTSYDGSACNPFCIYGPSSSTIVAPDGSGVLSAGEMITNGSIGGKGSLKNWSINGSLTSLP
ncbi:MAG: hypothetical protein ACJ8AS_09645 [Hyphomicrobiales bacterium]